MKTQRIRFFLVTFIAISCIIFPFIRQVQADPFSVYAQVQVPNNGLPNNAVSSYIPGGLNTSVATTGTTYQQYEGSTLGHALATATVGDLHAYADSATNTEYFNGFSYGTWGVARASTLFTDTITVVSSVLPTGTLVDVHFVIHLGGYFWYNGTNNVGVWVDHAYIESDYITAENTRALAGLSAPYLNNFSLQVSDNAYNHPESWFYIAPVSDYVMADVMAPVNYPFKISGGLSIEADSSTYIGWDPDFYNGVAPSRSTSMADFGDTATFMITSLNPDVSIIAASGHNYSLSSPVPEPATMLLLGFGLLGLAGYGRKKFFKK